MPIHLSRAENDRILDASSFTPDQLARIMKWHDAVLAAATLEAQEETAERLLKFLDERNTRGISRRDLYDFTRTLTPTAPDKEADK